MKLKKCQCGVYPNLMSGPKGLHLYCCPKCEGHTSEHENVIGALIEWNSKNFDIVVQLSMFDDTQLNLF